MVPILLLMLVVSGSHNNIGSLSGQIIQTSPSALFVLVTSALVCWSGRLKVIIWIPLSGEKSFQRFFFSRKKVNCFFIEIVSRRKATLTSFASRCYNALFIPHRHSCGLYYKPVTIVNDESSIVSKWSIKLIDDPSVIIYDHHRFIIQATGVIYICS